jgi:hypothetical protein
VARKARRAAQAAAQALATYRRKAARVRQARAALKAAKHALGQIDWISATDPDEEQIARRAFAKARATVRRMAQTLAKAQDAAKKAQRSVSKALPQTETLRVATAAVRQARQKLLLARDPEEKAAAKAAVTKARSARKQIRVAALKTLKSVARKAERQAAKVTNVRVSLPSRQSRFKRAKAFHALLHRKLDTTQKKKAAIALINCRRATRQHKTDLKAARKVVKISRQALKTATTGAAKSKAKQALFASEALVKRLMVLGIETCTTVKSVRKVVIPTVIVSGSRGLYQRFNDVRVSGNRFEVELSVRGTENARVAFMAKAAEKSDKAFEVVFGSAGDTVSELRLGTNGQALAVDRRSGRLASGKPFWVALREGVVFVGQGRFGKNTFLSAPIPELGKQLVMAYAAGDSPVLFGAKVRTGQSGRVGPRTCAQQQKILEHVDAQVVKTQATLKKMQATPANQRTKSFKTIRYHLRQALSFALKQQAAEKVLIRRTCKPVALARPARPTVSPIVYSAAGNNAHYVVFGPTVARKSFRLSFKAEATSDIHVAFMGSKSVRSDSAVEVVIGGWGDNQSVIRQGTQGRELASNSGSGQAKACAAGCWVRYDDDGTLSVGRASHDTPFLSAKVTLPAGQQLQVAFGAWDHPVYFSQVLAE